MAGSINRYKYKKYKESIEFIIKNGYDGSLEIAGPWKIFICLSCAGINCIKTKQPNQWMNSILRSRDFS
jgi:hypothetical protein